jgi:serine/threonine protein kinase
MGNLMRAKDRHHLGASIRRIGIPLLVCGGLATMPGWLAGGISYVMDKLAWSESVMLLVMGGSVGLIWSCLAMGVVDVNGAVKAKYQGASVRIPSLGSVQLLELLATNSETEVYRTNHRQVVIKVFDLSCRRADEVNYGPYMEFQLELANFEDLQNMEELHEIIPRYYGAQIDYEQKFACIAMEYLEGQDLNAWCREAAEADYSAEWVAAFHEAIYETLSLMRRFHQKNIILIDFKPDDILRLPDHQIKFVDLGAFFTPRQAQETQKYVYSTTPDHAELVIDSSNVPTGVPLTKASDLFSAGVAMFEMATGASRLAIDGDTADEILRQPELYQFRNSQIRGVWHTNPSLRAVVPLLETQLAERRLLFSEFWPLLKGYVAGKLPGWHELESDQQDQIILTTGTTFILEQLPSPLQWLAGPVAQATTLRSMRIKTVAELLKMLEQPVPPEVREEISQRNCLVRYLRDLDQEAGLMEQLNVWDVRLNPATGLWALSARMASAQLVGNASFAFLNCTHQDEQHHRYYQIVDDQEADDGETGKLTVWQLKNDHFAWIGS